MKLEVFFDYACPYCLTGLNQFKKLILAHAEIEVEWWPCEAHPRPESYGIHSDIAVQGMYFALENGVDAWDYHGRMFEAVFEEKLDIERPEIIADIMEDLGLSAAEFIDAVKTGVYADIPKKNNRYAWGENRLMAVPSYKMNGRLLKSRDGAAVTEQELAAFLLRR